MFELVHPYALSLVPLPFLIHWLLPAYRRRKNAIQVPFFESLVEISGEAPAKGAVVSKRRVFRGLILILIWLCTVVALARPQYVGAPIDHRKSARDLMIAVDLSASMQAKDFVDQSGQKVDRLSAVKSVLKGFVEQRPHDRLGLIVFGDAPFLQAPFTQDHATWTTLLNETEIAMAGMSTALGDAIGLAIKNFHNNESENRVLIVLTDGNDTGSSVPPIEAAKVAANYGVTIYPIAIGDPETGGEEALDIVTLNRVAELTQGVFYQALDRQELLDIYQQIAKLEPQEFEYQSYRPRHDLHYVPFSVVTILLLVFMLLAVWQIPSRANPSQ
ncbi:MAG: Ca-activated chloride channel family protein [Cryomorphaceae bacterium]|jgi:Ca-activated chloride channel family protein